MVCTHSLLLLYTSRKVSERKILSLTYAQFQCTTDADCAHHCLFHFGHQCREGTCHCFHLPVDLGGVGRRQACTQHDECTCADGATGHCDHAGVCHCHH
ncbi:hypothetical protein ACJMK2_022799 [Sinanodonta woodiana]|uniref:Uncharacterized protein n=1 Tax=Sinanodonta woodiana TaxID=1069815 RepID=A0ABD3TKA3_SINWO